MFQKLINILKTFNLYVEPYRALITYHMLYILFYTFIFKSIYLLYIYIGYFYFETLSQFVEKLAFIFFIVCFIYLLLHKLVPLNKWTDKIVAHILSNTSFLLFFVYTPFETHYFMLRGDLYEKSTFRDKILMGIALGSALYVVPIVFTYLNFHLGAILWGFFMFLPYYISRLFDTKPLTPLYNIEFIREVIDDDEKSYSLIFNDSKFIDLPQPIKEIYINLYKSVKNNSIFFSTFMFYVYVLKSYPHRDIMFIFSRSLIIKYENFFQNANYKQHIYEYQPNEGKFMHDIPLSDKSFLLAGGIISTKNFLLRQIIAGGVAAGTGTVLGEQYFRQQRQLERDRFEHNKELQNNNQQHEKFILKHNAVEREKERDHELIMKGIKKIPQENGSRSSIWPFSSSSNSKESKIPPSNGLMGGSGSIDNLD